jgi:hypothetical protein
MNIKAKNATARNFLAGEDALLKTFAICTLQSASRQRKPAIRWPTTLES